MLNKNSKGAYLAQLEYDLNNLLVYYNDLELLQIVVHLLAGDMLDEKIQELYD